MRGSVRPGLGSVKTELRQSTSRWRMASSVSSGRLLKKSRPSSLASGTSKERTKSTVVRHRPPTESGGLAFVPSGDFGNWLRLRAKGFGHQRIPKGESEMSEINRRLFYCAGAVVLLAGCVAENSSEQAATPPEQGAKSPVQYDASRVAGGFDKV